MKYYKILFLLASFVGLSSCAVHEIKDFDAEKPAHLENYEYLKEYDVLNSYIDRNAYPNFKLGAGVTASKFVQHGQEYLMAVSNFDEVTPGNAMKYASVVANDGKMTFEPVKEFVNDAVNAGMSVYGHTLAWHSQQNNKFLNSLIADRIDPDYKPEYEEQIITKSRTCIEVVTKDMAADPWDSQFWIVLPKALSEGDEWEVSMDLLALNEAGVGTQLHGEPGAYLHWNAIGNPAFGTEWSTWTNKGVVDAGGNGALSIAFNLNDYQPANIYYLDNISFKVNGVEQITNGNCDDPAGTANFVSKEYPGNPAASRIVSEHKQKVMVEIKPTETVTRTCLKVNAPAMVSYDYDSQFWFLFEPSDAFQEGDEYELTMDVRADVEVSVPTQTHKDPGAYLNWQGIGNVPFTKEWTTLTITGKFESTSWGANPIGGYSIAFNLSGASDNAFYFDNISFKINGKEKITNGNCDDPAGTKNFYAKSYPAPSASPLSPIVYTYTVELPGGRTPLTPEEKKENLTKAMNDWIKGMMDATDGKVKTWDAVNEPISGVDNDGDGKYDLQSAENGDPDANFYWQDYLGSEDYVRLVVANAREHYKGNPEELKLFINDYNLESWWDGNKKLKSLLSWIDVWEADGKTKIDGIGTQMHVSYILNEKDQKAQEDAIVKMFELLRDSGRLVKISELDMGIVENAFGPGIAASAVTEEQHQKMADFYKFIVSKYLEIIPAAQQYGITQWCTSDPGGSLGEGWRGGEPVGLWDVNYGRKHTYAGFAAGLQGE